MEYPELHHQAKHIDRLIDENIHAKRTVFLTTDQLQTIVVKVCPDFYVEDRGWHKIVFRHRRVDKNVVLKIGPQQSIENDHRTYKRVPHRIRHQIFARLFWHTKYCLLQEYGDPADVSAEQLSCIRRLIYRFGIFDVKADNLRKIEGDLKIIDANAIRIPLPTQMRIADELKAKFPEKLERIIGKVIKRLKKLA